MFCMTIFMIWKTNCYPQKHIKVLTQYILFQYPQNLIVTVINVTIFYNILIVFNVNLNILTSLCFMLHREKV